LKNSDQRPECYPHSGGGSQVKTKKQEKKISAAERFHAQISQEIGEKAVPS
jgi:hypothetical protein